MLADIASFVTDAMGVGLRAAFGRDSNGKPNPDNPANLRFIFCISIVISGIVACVGSLIALVATGTFTAVWLTFAILLVIGLLASFRAVFP
ncbi:hypothetical protein [Novipirellula maiorica]|uniref:hypothetical protein n=1 Tax=Novipirellula maiorica TaxID=1265734 RepID=UPI00118182B4|nr:hypothetical protein [Rhodopirellula maiorica]